MRAAIGLCAFVLTVAAGALTPAGAVVAVRETSIAEGETFELSPFAIEVRFSQAVQLVNARLVDQQGREAPLDLSFYRAPAQAFVIELPVLPPHGYRFVWRVRGGQGPDQQGSVGFIVKGCEDPRAVAATARIAAPVRRP